MVLDEGFKARVLKELKRHGLKATPQRIKLAEALEKLGEKHPTISTVLEEVRRTFPSMSFSTLYSNLLMLDGLGLLKLFNVGGETRVELNPKPHLNLIFQGRVVDLEDEELIKRIERKTGKRVDLINVLLE